MSDLINRQDALDAIIGCTNCETAEQLRAYVTKHSLDNGWIGGVLEAFDAVEDLPSTQSDYQEVLGWLLAYHTMSFDLHGRYLPHEVISWLINDFTKEFIAERGQNG